MITFPSSSLCVKFDIAAGSEEEAADDADDDGLTLSDCWRYFFLAIVVITNYENRK
jgi:hypothetical protein